MNTDRQPYPHEGAAKRLFWYVMRQLAKHSYYCAKVFYKHQLHQTRCRYNAPPLLIYQMGKVGSETVQRSLAALNLDMPIYHVHFLSQDRIAETEKSRRSYFLTDQYSALKRPWLNGYLREQLDKGTDGQKWKIVTLVREPIARNLSAFFENIEVQALDGGQSFHLKSDYHQIEITLKLENIKVLMDLFLEKLNHDAPLEFFDREVKDIFGLDVFASEFPTEKGYRIYENQKADVLLIRLEDLNRCARDAFKDFMGLDKFTLINTNIGSEKSYAALYKTLKSAVVLPDNYIEKMYGSKYMRHFYSATEIADFENRWRK